METLTDFCTQLRLRADTLAVTERQKIVRLLIKEILAGRDILTIRHLFRIPSAGPDPIGTPHPPHAPQQRAARLGEFLGETVPQPDWVSFMEDDVNAHPFPELMQRADEIAKGTIFFYDREPIRIGLKDIDWSGSQLHHQEWHEELNRFQFLDPLAAAYKATGQERFAEAARAYIEDCLSQRRSSATGERLDEGDSTLDMAIRLARL